MRTIYMRSCRVWAFNWGRNPVRVASIDQVIAAWKGLLESGVYVNMVTPPATPDGGCLLRCSVSAGHSPEQIKKIGNGFASLKEVVRETETA